MGVTETLGDHYSKNIPLPIIPNNRELGKDSLLPQVTVAAMGISNVAILPNTTNVPANSHQLLPMYVAMSVCYTRQKYSFPKRTCDSYA